MFGYAVALEGDTTVIGAQGARIGDREEQGAAYVFTRSGHNWSQQGKLFATDGAAGDLFGCSVAVDGGTAVIGTKLADAAGEQNAGKIYVTRRGLVAWSSGDSIAVSAGGPYDYFGISVDVDGDTAVVGAFQLREVITNAGENADNAVSGEGRVYIFTYEGATWENGTGSKPRMGSSLAGRFRFLTTPLVTHTPYGNLEILTHIPLDGETAAAFHEMSTQTPAQALQISSWPEKHWG